MTDYDSPWKTLLNDYFPEFMAFFFPDAYSEIDWSHGYDDLDTELPHITRDAELGKRRADKLIKVQRHHGNAQIVLIHIEVQTQADFAKRMFVYHYRLFDRYDQSIVSLAVLADPHRSWRPTRYECTLWGCQLQFTFPTIKLRDYWRRLPALAASTNPFAVIVQAHLQSQATQRKPLNRLYSKLHLVRRLYEQGYSRQQVLDLFY